MSRTRRPLTAAAALLAVAVGFAAVRPASASASMCGAVGLVNGVAGKACTAVTGGDKLLRAGKKLVSGHIGSAAKAVLGGGGGGDVSRASTAIGLAAIGTWVLGGAKAALTEAVHVIGKTTSPRLTTTWFSSTYWRIAGIAALLTLPFLFAAAVQALIRSDISLLARAAFGYLPLSLLAVSIAAPLTMLLLAACDQMSAIVSSAVGHSGGGFLSRLALRLPALTLLARSAFLAFLVGLLTAAAAIVLWIEMLMRETAIYIVVLMLPLAFAAMVWPARRVWALRSAEMLVALILSKFAIVAVITLGGAALGQSDVTTPGGMLAGLVLVVLGACAPWALVRLLPLAELASGAAGQLSGEIGRLKSRYDKVEEGAGRVEDWASSVSARMRRHADQTAARTPDRTRPDDLSGELETPAPSDEHSHEEAAMEAVDAVLVAVGGEERTAVDETELGDTAPHRTRVERLPGMPAQYQAPNGAWGELVFGPQEWSERPVWPPEDGEPETDDEVPPPPAQDPGEGRL